MNWILSKMNKDVDVWLVSDHHFGHSNSLKFISSDGLRMRREFETVEEMNNVMIEKHNSVVGEQDKVYFLGDVSFRRQDFFDALERMNGKKRLILGNHDKFPMDIYMKFFNKIMESWQPMRGLVLTHRPILLGNSDVGLKANIHGHIHRANIDDPRYFNVSVENIDYTPIRMSKVLEIFRERGVDV